MPHDGGSSPVMPDEGRKDLLHDAMSTRYRVCMQTLALVCQKGGSGKTTLAIHLAMEGAAQGLRTLILDLDPQASAARWGDRRKSGAIDVDVTVDSPGRLDAALQAARREGYDLVVLDSAPTPTRAPSAWRAPPIWCWCRCAARSSISTPWAPPWTYATSPGGHAGSC